MLGRRHVDERQRARPGPILLAGTDSRNGRSSSRSRRSSVRLLLPDRAGAGSDAGGIATTARRDGDGYVLNGRKCFITNGAHASQYTSLRRPTGPGAQGLSAFVVRGRRPGSPRGRRRTRWAARFETSDVLFEDVRVPEADRSGRGRGVQDRHADDRRRARGVAAMAVASPGRRTSTRRSTGARGPVRSADRDEPGDLFPARRHGDRHRGGPAADVEGGVVADQGKRNTKESSFAKAFAADLAMRAPPKRFRSSAGTAT